MTAKSQTRATRHKTDQGRTGRPAKKSSKVRPAVKAQASRERARLSPRTAVGALRHRYQLSRELFAHMLGVTEATLAKWESGAPLGPANRIKVQRVRGLLHQLEQAMRRSYIATWLRQSSAACADLGVQTPADLFARGDYRAIEDMIFFLGAGVAF